MKRQEPRYNDHVRIIKGSYVGREGTFLGGIVWPEYHIELEEFHYIWIRRSYFLLDEEGYEPFSFWRFFGALLDNHPAKEEHYFD